MGLTASFFCTFTRFVDTTESVRVGEKPSNSLQIRRVGTSERAQTVEDGSSLVNGFLRHGHQFIDNGRTLWEVFQPFSVGSTLLAFSRRPGSGKSSSLHYM